MPVSPEVQARHDALRDSPERKERVRVASNPKLHEFVAAGVPSYVGGHDRCYSCGAIEKEHTA